MQQILEMDHVLSDDKLHRIARRASWSVDCPQLSRHQIKSLLEDFEHRIISAKRELVTIILNELYVHFVEEHDVWREAQSASLGWGPEGPNVDEREVPKRDSLARIVRDEFTHIEKAIAQSEDWIRSLSADAHAVLEASYRHHSRGQRFEVELGAGFRRNWRRMHEVLTLICASCERADVTTTHVAAATQAELIKLAHHLDALVRAVDSSSFATHKASHYLSRGTVPSDIPVMTPATPRSPLLVLGNWLAYLRAVVDADKPRVKQGPARTPSRRLVEGLAELYLQTTGHEAPRYYRDNREHSGEAGPLLYLASHLIKYARNDHPWLKDRVSPSVSGIVKDVIKRRKASKPL